MDTLLFFTVLGEYVLYLVVHEHPNRRKLEFLQQGLLCDHLVGMAFVARGSLISMVNSPLLTQN